MCGIAGIVSLGDRPVGVDEVRAMCGAIVHRGPDAGGFFFDSGVGLGMRRLSIIDLATGDQPIRNEDGSVWVVFNGEIYNFGQLRGDLLRRGHRFYTTGDTETLVHLWEDLGPRCVERLRGMFAFALWDGRQRRLLLARDRLGIKPLYYAEVGGRLAFASELKALLQLPDIEGRLNWPAVSRLFTFRSTSSEESAVAGVRKLPPGHILLAEPGRPVRIERYWDVTFEPQHGRSEVWWTERLREVLDESVRLHLVSDVPVGAFLSGGIDSSSVVMAMARAGAGPVKTFSIGFPEARYSEVASAQLVARQAGTEHHELIVKPDVVGVLEDIAAHLDEPFGDSSAIPTYMVSALAARHVKVVLSGDGGDELFAGYDRYLVEARERRLPLPAPARRLLGAMAQLMPDGMRGRNAARHFALSGPDRYLDAATLFRRDDQRRLFQPEVLAQMDGYDPWHEERRWLQRAGGDWLTALQYLDIKSYLPLDILTKVDRMSMAHSLETRVPLLDHEVVEFAATIPPELKLRNGTTKYIFKRALRGLLPDAILNRPKHGFSVPVTEWFRGDLEGFVRDLLLSPAARRRDIFDAGYIERVLARHRRGRDLSGQLWTLVSFELWCRVVLERRFQPTAAEPAPASRQMFPQPARA
jgi:asparagine synthase (glutamine-hydrolysing)